MISIMLHRMNKQASKLCFRWNGWITKHDETIPTRSAIIWRKGEESTKVRDRLILDQCKANAINVDKHLNVIYSTYTSYIYIV